MQFSNRLHTYPRRPHDQVPSVDPCQKEDFVGFHGESERVEISPYRWVGRGFDLERYRLGGWSH